MKLCRYYFILIAFSFSLSFSLLVKIHILCGIYWTRFESDEQRWKTKKATNKTFKIKSLKSNKLKKVCSEWITVCDHFSHLPSTEFHSFHIGHILYVVCFEYFYRIVVIFSSLFCFLPANTFIESNFDHRERYLCTHGGTNTHTFVQCNAKSSPSTP